MFAIKKERDFLRNKVLKLALILSRFMKVANCKVFEFYLESDRCSNHFYPYRNLILVSKAT